MHYYTQNYWRAANANNYNPSMLSQPARLHQQGGGHKTGGPPTHVRPRLYYIFSDLYLAALLPLHWNMHDLASRKPSLAQHPLCWP